MLKDLFIELKKLDFPISKKDFYEVELDLFDEILAIFLMQNTKWEKVLKSLQNIKINQITMDNILDCDLATLIKPSGFYNTKAKNIKEFFKTISKDYLQNGMSLIECVNALSKEYLLSIKGISEHTADSILCFIKQDDVLIMDSNFKLIASYLGYEFESYGELREIFTDAIFENINELLDIYGAKNINELMIMVYFGVGRFCQYHYVKKDFTPLAKQIFSQIA